jgi:flagellar biosynthesis/type III secretory pathway protein FliH
LALLNHEILSREQVQALFPRPQKKAEEEKEQQIVAGEATITTNDLQGLMERSFKLGKRAGLFLAKAKYLVEVSKLKSDLAKMKADIGNTMQKTKEEVPLILNYDKIRPLTMQLI